MIVSTTTQQCVAAFPKWLGCVLANHENLSGGLIGAGGALFAGWLAWSAVWAQIDLTKSQLAIQKTWEISIERTQLVQRIERLQEADAVGDALDDKLRAIAGTNTEKFATLARSHAFPSAGNLAVTAEGLALNNAINRLRSLGQDIQIQLGQHSADKHGGILMMRQADADDAIAEFDLAWNAIDPAKTESERNLAAVELRLSNAKDSNT